MTVKRLIRLCGMRQADLERWIEAHPFHPDVRHRVMPAPSGADLLLSSGRETFLETAVEAIGAEWGLFCYSFDGQTLEEVVGGLLVSRRKHLSVAESCTGGRIAARLTRVAGSSRYFEFSCVTYSDRSKERLLSVPGPLIGRKGAVSPEVASAMAEGVRRIEEGVDLGLAVTGIAGPGGGSLEKPVGLVYIALSDGKRTTVTPFRFDGEREAIQEQAAQTALDSLRRYLVAEKADGK